MQLDLDINGTTQTMTFQLFDNAPATAATVGALIGNRI